MEGVLRTDMRLVEGAASGVESDFAELATRHEWRIRQHRHRRLGSLHDADDAAQDEAGG
jgi:DNA-directed RNA polymerase specialized sigma24 family protein